MISEGARRAEEYGNEGWPVLAAEVDYAQWRKKVSVVSKEGYPSTCVW